MEQKEENYKEKGHQVQQNIPKRGLKKETIQASHNHTAPQ